MGKKGVSKNWWWKEKKQIYVARSIILSWNSKNRNERNLILFRLSKLCFKIYYHILLFEIFSLSLFLNLRGYGLLYSLCLTFCLICNIVLYLVLFLYQFKIVYEINLVFRSMVKIISKTVIIS